MLKRAGIKNRDNPKKPIHFRNVSFVFILLSILFGVSCREEIIPYKEELVTVSFDCSIAQEKTLTAEIDTDIALYTYTAEALFTLSDGSYVYGDTNGAEKNIGPLGSETFGSFTQGKWKFHVYAYNKDGGLVRDGETTVYLRKNDDTGLLNTVPITITRTSLRTGSVHFSFITTQVSTSKPYVIVTPVREGEVKAARTFYAASITDDKATFDFTLSGLQSGAWEFRLETYDGTVKEGGGAVSTYILGNDTTEVSGEVYPTEWVMAGFAITMPEQITGTIGTSISASPGNVSFLWSSTSGTATKYKWYIDGTLKADGTSTSFTNNFQNPGIYSVTCVAIDASGKEMGHSTCSVNIAATAAVKSSWTWTNLKTASPKSETLNGTVTKRPTVRLLIEETSGVILYSGYPSITGTTGSWTATGSLTQNGTAITVTITLTGTTVKVSSSKDISGYVTVEVGL